MPWVKQLKVKLEVPICKFDEVNANQSTFTRKSFKSLWKAIGKSTHYITIDTVSPEFRDRI